MWSQFREYKEIGAFGSKYSPTVSRVFLQQPFLAFFCTVCHSQTLCNEKRNFVFPLIFIGALIGFKILILPLKIQFLNELFNDMPSPFLTHYRVDFFIFHAKIFKNTNYFRKKLVNAYSTDIQSGIGHLKLISIAPFQPNKKHVSKGTTETKF